MGTARNGKEMTLFTNMTRNLFVRFDMSLLVRTIDQGIANEQQSDGTSLPAIGAATCQWPARTLCKVP
jgi:hypothetical protein